MKKLILFLMLIFASLPIALSVSTSIASAEQKVEYNQVQKPSWQEIIYETKHSLESLPILAALLGAFIAVMRTSFRSRPNRAGENSAREFFRKVGASTIVGIVIGFFLSGVYAIIICLLTILGYYT